VRGGVHHVALEDWLSIVTQAERQPGGCVGGVKGPNMPLLLVLPHFLKFLQTSTIYSTLGAWKIQCAILLASSRLHLRIVGFSVRERMQERRTPGFPIFQPQDLTYFDVCLLMKEWEGNYVSKNSHMIL
jgi:hypothetical protein